MLLLLGLALLLAAPVQPAAWMLEKSQQALPTPTREGHVVACRDGLANEFPCSGVDMLARLTLNDLGEAGQLNDIWGWTDPETGKEIVLVGHARGTAFIDISDPVLPRYLGVLPTHTTSRIWRDIKTYRNYAFIVSEAREHGMQVFDLTALRHVTDPPAVFEATVHYGAVNNAHNIAINEETGFAYIVGAHDGGTTCSGGLHMVNIQNPLKPTFSGCFTDLSTGITTPGYTHDVQCVVYHGPDSEHWGREICIGANETHLSIADVAEKAQPRALSTATYPDVGYIHQGWLTEDHRYFFQNDETDEINALVLHTRTLIWDLADLDDPQLLSTYFGPTAATDHNQYVVGSYLFQANNTSGLRILDISDVTTPREVVYFDTYPAHDSSGFAGAWSVYPFFESGVVAVSDREGGLFVLQPMNLPLPTETPAITSVFDLMPAYPNPFTSQTQFTLRVSKREQVKVAVYDALGRHVAVLHDGLLLPGSHSFSYKAEGLPSGVYLMQATGESVSRNRIVTFVR